MIKDILVAALQKAVKEAVGVEAVPNLEHPTQPAYGDYSSNIALVLFGDKKLKLKERGVESPLKLASKIASNLQSLTYNARLRTLDKVEVAPPGFINMWLSNDVLLKELACAKTCGEQYGRGKKKQKIIVLEHTSPNTNKPLHIGHIRNNILAMALLRIFRFYGFKVYPTEIINDRGAQIMQSIWGYLRFGKEHGREYRWEELLAQYYKSPEAWAKPASIKGDHFVGQFYVRAEKVKDEAVEAEIASMLQTWEKGNRKLRKLWQTMNKWFYEGVEKTYKRLGSEKSKRFYESKIYKKGKEIIEKNLGKVFEKNEEGAIIANLSAYNLPDAVVLRSDGTSLYITQDIALLVERKKKFQPDLFVYVVASEQNLHFKQLFAIACMLGIAKEENLYHLGYGLVRLKDGTMSSRLGTVILADSFLDEMSALAEKKIEEAKIKKEETKKEDLAESIGIGAVKYSMLKFSPSQDIVFDPEKTISFEGDSGPYLQYTYARTKSVLEQAKVKVQLGKDKIYKFNKEELAILRYFYRFPEVIEESARLYAPNLLCNFLYELARRFNSLYNQHRISNNKLRLVLTEVVGNILKSGLGLLGIRALEKM